MLTATIFDIKRFAINDGPGIRTAVFFKGCPLDCWWCHNPEGRDRHPQIMYRSNRCSLCGDCISACPQGAIRLEKTLITTPELCQDCGICCQECVHGARELVGRKVTVDDVCSVVERDTVFFDQSGGGVTLTGGEPLVQHRFALELLRKCKSHSIHTVMDTSGYVNWTILAAVAEYTDLFLYDLKLMDDERHRKYTGVSNKIILENLTRLSALGSRVFVRIPLIPGINDDEVNLLQSQQYLRQLPNLSGVDVLPYHDIARAKYSALELAYRLPEIVSPSPEQVAWARGLVGI